MKRTERLTFSMTITDFKHHEKKSFLNFVSYLHRITDFLKLYIMSYRGYIKTFITFEGTDRNPIVLGFLQGYCVEYIGKKTVELQGRHLKKFLR